MIYYIVLYFFITVFFIMEKIYKKKFFLYLVVVIVFLFSALRFDAGYDYFHYLTLILFETGFSFDRLEYLNKILIYFSRENNFPQFYFIATSFFYMLFMVLGLKENKSFTSISLILLVFFVGSYLASFDIIRQMVAASIVFYAVSLFVNKKYLISILLFLLAMGFHKSAIIFIPVIFYITLFSRERSSFFYIILLVFSFLLLTPVVAFLSSQKLYYGYIESGGNDSGSKIYLLVLFYFLSLLVIAKSVSIKSDMFWKAFNLFFLGIMLYTLFLPYGYFVTRISYFLIPWSFVAWSLLYEFSFRNKKAIYAYIYIISSFSYFMALYISSFSERNPFLNYKFYFLS